MLSASLLRRSFQPQSVARASALLHRASAARTFAAGANPTAKFKTSMGDFEAELYADKLPVTVGNFVDLSKTGFYDGVTFHRVIPNFMCQFGCPNAKDPTSTRAGTGGPAPNTKYISSDGKDVVRDAGGNIPDELVYEVSNEVGTLSMANTGRPNSGGSQFFINTAHNKFLDYFDKSSPSKHPVFGRITSGMDVVNAIGNVKTGPGDKPVEPVVMNTVEIA